MNGVVRWRLLLRVGSREKALRLVDREVTPRLGGDCRLVSDERYWKGPELWCVAVEQRLSWPSDAAAVYEVLRTADRLGIGWCVSGPNEAARSLDGVFAADSGGKPRFSGLDWASFELAREPEHGAQAESASHPPRP